MIVNPIIRRELLSTLRTRRALAMQVLFLLVLAAMVWLLWPVDGLQDIGGQQGRLIFSVLAVAQLLMVVAFAPTLTATAFTLERERNTLESLFATAMKPRQIVLGKIVGALGFLLLLVLSGSAALACPLLLGGVTGGKVLLVIALLLVTAVYLGMIGLLVSTLLHRSYRAVIVTFVILFVLVFLSALPAWPITGPLIKRGHPAWQATLHVVASVSPLQAMISVVMSDSPYNTRVAGMPAYSTLYFLIAGAVTGLGALACWLRLREPIAPPRPREKLKVIERGKITARSFIFVVDPRKRKRMIFDWQNPVLIKEFRSRPMLQAHWLLRAVGICLISSVLLVFVVTIGIQAFVGESMNMFVTLSMSVAALMVVLIVLVGPAITSGAICSDRESGVWDLLRTTRLSSWRIVSGKFQASVIPLLLLAAAMMPALFILVYFNEDLLPSVLRIAAVVGMTVLFVAMAGMFFSSLCSRTGTATAWTYALVITIALLTLLALLAEDLFSQRLLAAIFLVNPVAAALDAAGHPGLKRYGLMVPHLKIMAVASAGMFLVTVLRVCQLRRAEDRTS